MVRRGATSPQFRSPPSRTSRSPGFPHDNLETPSPFSYAFTKDKKDSEREALKEHAKTLEDEEEEHEEQKPKPSSKQYITSGQVMLFFVVTAGLGALFLYTFTNPRNFENCGWIVLMTLLWLLFGTWIARFANMAKIDQDK